MALYYNYENDSILNVCKSTEPGIVCNRTLQAPICSVVISIYTNLSQSSKSICSVDSLGNPRSSSVWFDGSGLKFRV